MIQVTVLSDEGTLPPVPVSPEFIADMCVLAMVMERDHAKRPYAVVDDTRVYSCPRNNDPRKPCPCPDCC